MGTSIFLAAYFCAFQDVAIGIRIKNWHEVLGQIPKLLGGGVKSFVGRIPMGNTGGANVPPLQPMEIPGDLKEILGKFKQ